MIVPTANPPDSEPPPKPPDLSSIIFQFETTKWSDPPEFVASDPNDAELVYRRKANDDLYRQKETAAKWNRYITLGYYSLDDGVKFDQAWNKMEEDPLHIHRIIWYNFLYHVDRDMDIDPLLNAWATKVSEVFLTKHAPTALNMNTMTYAFKEAVENLDEMDVDEPGDTENDKWIQVTRTRGRSRNRSPASNTNQNQVPVGIHDEGVDIPGLYIPNCPPKTSLPTSNVENENPDTETRMKANTDPITNHNDDQTQEDTLPNQDTDTNQRKEKLPNHESNPTNDGTHRLIFRWTPKSDAQMVDLEEDTTKMPETILEIIKPLFKDSDGSFYRWESKNLQRSNTISTITTGMFREFISPHITFMQTRRQIVFGLRFGYSTSPVQWRDSETRDKLEAANINLKVSNSSCTSGNLVTAGYILLKAPNSTHRHRFNQHLATMLPEQTPHFDVIRMFKTPMDDTIPHLAIQCGEHHVTPLCETLSKYVTGNKTAIFIPRYALQTMSDEQVKELFEFHQTWNKSLCPVQMSPLITHLDQTRKEIFPDGSIMERSTREWATTLTLSDGKTPALCDVVNGTQDRRALLLAPAHFVEEARRQWEAYRKRIFPPRFRVERFRETPPGDLPEVINITTDVRANMEFLRNMSSAEIWSRAPATVRGETTTINTPGMTTNNHSTGSQVEPDLPNAPPGWNTNRGQSQQTPTVPQKDTDPQRSNADNLTPLRRHANVSQINDDQSTDSTHALTRTSQSEYTNRFATHEAMFKRQQKALDSLSKTSSDRLSVIERQLHRFDTFDENLATMGSKIDQFVDYQQDLHVKLTALGDQSNESKRQARESQAQSDKKIDTLSTTVIAAMNAILEIRNQFETMSQQVQQISNSYENQQTTKRNQNKAEPNTRNSNEDRSQEISSIAAEYPREFDSSSQNSSHQSSNASSTPSTFSVHSPVKKKRFRQRDSRQSSGNNLRRNENSINLDNNDQIPDNDNPNMEMEGTNLTLTFDQQVLPGIEDLVNEEDLVTDVEMFLTPPTSPVTDNSTNTAINNPTIPAPLDPQYNEETGPAGATEK